MTELSLKSTLTVFVFVTVSIKITVHKQPPEVLCKKEVFLEISQNSQENNCAIVSFLLKLQALHKLVILSKIIISFVEDSL